MARISVETGALLNARAEDVYATIADYHRGHPAILPEGAFYNLRVEQGGYGEGTIIRFTGKVWGIEQHFYQRVSEPEPGHILVERDIDLPRDLATTFTITPEAGGRKARVVITTEMNASRGVAGLIEGLVLHLANPPIYRRELKLLEAVAQRRSRPTVQADL